ncbi:MAG: hypothetical protein HY094_08285 [Candidatus Melainabacteria bacterium]|nr:hypothetical protein [Candidatus Melainabacteria bacterium]
MLCILKLVFFLFCPVSFGLLSLSGLTKIKSPVLLTPLSISFGISAYLFICHVLSFIMGPKIASVLALFILLLFSLIVLITSHKNIFKFKKEITNHEMLTLILLAVTILTLTHLAIYRFGTFDKEFHLPFVLTMYQNNVYPPRDLFRPDYVLLYHYGGDLLAGAIYNFCNIDISRAYELVATFSACTIFLSFIALAWTLTNNFKLSLIAGFCSYFGGGLLWLDAICRYLLKILPQGAENWSFLQTYFNLGLHGGIINAPSICCFVSTFNLGYPILILVLILFWKMLGEDDLKINIFYLTFLVVSLFILFLSAEWLYMTFWAGVIPFLFFLFWKKKRKHLIFIFALLAISVVLSKTIGNALFLQDPIQSLGRRNIFDISIKEKLFWITSWGRLTTNIMRYEAVYFFSWNFIVEFGLSIILFLFSIIYLKKTQNLFALLLFLCAVTTMPLPLILDFKINPVDLNRLFAFGNTIIILLITCGLSVAFKSFLKNKLLIFTYIVFFCLSPISELLSSAVFTPYITFSKTFTQTTLDKLKTVHSINDFKQYITEFNDSVLKLKNHNRELFKNEIEFLKSNCKPGDVAISNLAELPAYGGVYTLIPAGKFLYKDLLYSSFDSIFPTTLTTLDPYLLDELNVKWVIISNTLKNQLPKDTQDILSNTELFNLAYVGKEKNNGSKEWFEIYHLNNIKTSLDKFKRKIGWLLVDQSGRPIEITILQTNKISLFPHSKDALLYLKSLYSIKPNLKKELITAQTIETNSLEQQISADEMPIMLDKRF